MIRLLLALVLSGTFLPAKKRPNILFLFADDQRADTIAAHGNPHIQTPHLDRLSQEGFSFRKTIAPVHSVVPFAWPVEQC